MRPGLRADARRSGAGPFCVSGTVGVLLCLALFVLPADRDLLRNSAQPVWPEILPISGGNAVSDSCLLHRLHDLLHRRVGLALLCRVEPGVARAGLRVALDL